jgi:AraC-like DNA-binding protein
VQPSADLAPFISIAWILHWDLGEDAHVQRVLPDPCVQIVVDAGGAHIMGVVTGSFSVTLTGKRLVLGMKFRPGGFYPFLRQPVASLTDRTVRVSHCFPNADERQLADCAAAGDGHGIVVMLEALLRRAAPVMDAQLDRVYRVADRIATDSTLLTVEHTARVCGLSGRSIQRLFRTYVGVSPKWMIRRCRIQEAAARLEAGDVHAWSDLALDLGYADQSHFINDFRRLVGRSPASYAHSLEPLAEGTPGGR